jgi:hypothetical protein
MYKIILSNNQWPCLAAASVYPPSARDKLKEEALGSHRGRKRGEGRPERSKETRTLAQRESGLDWLTADGKGSGGDKTEVNGDSRSKYKRVFFLGWSSRSGIRENFPC